MRKIQKDQARRRLWVSLIATPLTIFFICMLAVSLAPAAASTTKKISTSSTGGDCSSIGVWDAATKTCTLTADLVASGSNGIEIVNDNITLDGDGHSMTGSGGFTSGVTFSVRTGVTVKNLTVSQFRYGINGLSSSANILTGNTLANNTNGIYLTASNSNRVYNNNFIGNSTQAIVSGTGNVFSYADMGGNFWSNYNTPGQGCNDDDGDFYCDAAYPFTGGQDPQAYTVQDGWNITHPPDSIPPEVTGVLPAGEIGTMSATIRVYYNDPGSNIKLASVSVYLDGSRLTGCPVTQESASCDVYGLAMGPHSISGSLSDNQGNSSSFNGSFDVADRAAPSVDDFKPSGYINTGSTVLSASYSDYLGSGIDSSTTAVYLDGGLVAGCTATTAGVDCPVSGLVDGTHMIMVYVGDVSGNRGSGSASFQMDSSSPAVGPVQPSGSVSTGSATISTYFSDSGSGVDAASTVVYLDGVELAGCAATASDISCPVSNLAPGPHAISGSVADNAGNNSAINGSFTFLDNTAPAVSNILPTGTISSGSATLKATFTDGTGSGISSSTVSVYLDGSVVSGCTVSAASASCGVYGLANGSHLILVGVDDKAGNHGSGSGSFTVDTSKPEVSPMRYIKDNPTGGDCVAIGSWDQYSKTCALSTDLNFSRNGIVIVGNNITLDGNGHTLTGSGAFTTGVSTSVSSGNTIYNLKVKNFGYGINLLSANGNTITDNTLQGNKYGVYLSNSGSNVIYRNNFVDNITSAFVSSGGGNAFDQPDPDGGNYWSSYDTPEEGCLNDDGDGYCDAAFAVYGGQ
ncbi:MAG: NosD domain-containing protein, partial [Thermoleophilia bacterium]|nr:NosD domain-containing protein [Thermoleophilia bacterium]